jgi:hypothetical protein
MDPMPASLQVRRTIDIHDGMTLLWRQERQAALRRFPMTCSRRALSVHMTEDQHT